MKNALRASKLNRLEEQACLTKEITLVVGTKVVCSLDLLIQLFAEKCCQPGCQLATTVSQTLCGTSVLNKWRFAKFLGLSFVSRSTFCQAQRVYCIPAINEWWTWQQGIINHELQGQSLVVMGLLLKTYVIF